MKLKFVYSWIVILLLASPYALADQIKVAVASNFKLAAEELRLIFERQTGHRLSLISASTGVLYNQIIHGAPYDIFLAADSEHPLRLENQDLGSAGSRTTYALGQLVLAHGGGKGLSDKDLRGLLLEPGITIAIANPKTAPYGKAAKQTLIHLGIALEDLRLVTALNVALGYQMWKSGNAELAIVSASLTQNSDAISIPSHMHEEIKQQAIVLDRAKDNSAAWEFIKFLNTTTAQTVIVRHGYGLAETI